jgi:MFS family permease
MSVEKQMPTNPQTFVPWREFLVGSHLGSLALVCLAVWLHAADSMIMATMLPIIVDDVGGGAFIGWSVSLYEIGSIVAGTSSALLTIRWGLRRPMATAATLFGCGCLLSALSPNMALILVGRVVQGVGGGGLVAMSFIAVNTLFARRYTARALATVSTLWGLSAFLGPLIGGTFVQYATWRWGFVFFALQAFALAGWIALRRDNERPIGVDAVAGVPAGRLLLIFSSVLLISLGSFESRPIFTAAFFVVGLAALAMFFWLDGRAGDQRLFPHHAINPRYVPGAALLLVLSIAMATTAVTAFGPMLLIRIHGIAPMEAGYVLACSSVGWTVTAVIVSGSPERLDRSLIALGIGVSILSIAGLYYAVPNGPTALCAAFAFMEGGGLGIAWTFILRLATAHSAIDDSKRVSGAFPTTLRLGYALGAAYLGTIANAAGMATMRTQVETIYVAHWIFAGCTPFAILAIFAVIALVWRSHRSMAP